LYATEEMIFDDHHLNYFLFRI